MVTTGLRPRRMWSVWRRRCRLAANSDPRRVRYGGPDPLGKQRSRDVKDERFIAAALAGHAEAIVSYDRDLLVLRKPFGIPIMRPAAFLAWMEQRRVG